MKNFFAAMLVLTAAVTAFSQTRTITNFDLDKYRIEREAADKALREKYARLGYPSPEEIQKQNEERQRERARYSDQLRDQRLQSQNSIIIQANQLRGEIAAIDAQINYLRRNAPSNSQTVILSTGYYGYQTYGGRGYRRQNNNNPLAAISQLPPNMRTVQEYGAMYPSSQSIYNQATGNFRINGRVNSNNGYRGGYVVPLVVGTTVNQDSSNGQLQFLEQQRAGLIAQWRILEEQARRAGVRID
jgi:hypothetical protein